MTLPSSSMSNTDTRDVIHVPFRETPVVLDMSSVPPGRRLTIPAATTAEQNHAATHQAHNPDTFTGRLRERFSGDNSVYVSPFSYTPADMWSIRPKEFGCFPLGKDLEAWIKKRNTPATIAQAENKLTTLRQFRGGLFGSAIIEFIASDVVRAFIEAGSKLNKAGELRQKTQKRIDAAKRHACANCAKRLMQDLAKITPPTPDAIKHIVTAIEASGVTLTKEGKLPKRYQRQLDAALARAAKRPPATFDIKSCADPHLKFVL